MKTILITGASTGIGEAVATVFAEKGWNVVATMRNPSAGTRLSGYENVLVTRLDVQDPESITSAVDTAIQRFGSIDILFNNAGMNIFGVFEEHTEAKIRQNFDVNVFGVMAVTRAVLPHFRERGNGVIVNVSSLAGLVGFPLNSLYNATKFAVEGFSEALAYELLAQNIVVKLVEPGLVKTNMTANWQNEFAPSSIADYAAYSTSVNELYTAMMQGEIPEAATVAQRIFEAATDGTDRLRYVVTDDAAGLLQSRSTMTDEERIQSMRTMFTPKA